MPLTFSGILYVYIMFIYFSSIFLINGIFIIPSSSVATPTKAVSIPSITSIT